MFRKDELVMDGKEEMDLLMSDKEIKVNGKRIIVHKYPMLSAIRLTSKLSNLVGKALSNDDSVKAIDTAFKAMVVEGDTEAETKGYRLYAIRTLLEMLGDELVDIISDVIVKSTNLNDEEVEDIDLEAGLDLLFTIYEVNKGFFTKFTKKLQVLSEKMASKAEESNSQSTRKKKA